MLHDLKGWLREALQSHANPDTKAWWENYVKGSAPFMGVKMPVIRDTLHQWHRQYVAPVLTMPAQLDLALSLFDELYTEEKLAGTLFLQEILLPAGMLQPNRDGHRFAVLFAEGKIYDWNVCDWFCVKVLGPLIREEGMDWARQIADWRDAENLWQARASLVPFTKVAADRTYDLLVESSCKVLIRREERFAKTAVGWVLREISRYDQAFVRGVIEANLDHFSAESLRNATKYFAKEDRDAYRRRLADLRKPPTITPVNPVR